MVELFFTIPTYRHREVHKCVDEYLNHFGVYNHQIPIIVFDDSPLDKSKITINFLSKVKKERPSADIRYIGPVEKRKYLSKLSSLNPDPLLPEMLCPSYGGNRNWILLATLGNYFISVDDDMHPYGIFNRTKKNNSDAVLEGTYTRDLSCFEKESVDLIAAYTSMIGRIVGDYIASNPNVRAGNHLVDSNMDLALNMTVGELKDNQITISPGAINPKAIIKIVQTYLSGDADIDSKDLIGGFIKSGSEEALRGVVPLKYAVNNFKPCIVAEDYRLTGAVLGLDNSEGFICFLPTKLRFEDYIFRSYSKKPEIHVGYCPAVQTHSRSLANRNNIVKDFVIEEIATVIKKSIINGVMGISELEIRLAKDPSYDVKELYDIWNQLAEYLSKMDITTAHGEAFADALKEEMISTERAGKFVANFTQRIDEEYSKIRRAIKIWPDMINYASRNPVPYRRISIS